MALSLPLRRALPQLPPLGFLSTASFALPLSITIPPLLADLWESVLRAVPKKKTSHMKKRHRQMAGKALKDVQSLNKCPGCGQVKRAHVLCPHCVKAHNECAAWAFANYQKANGSLDIKQSWKSAQAA